MDKSLTRVKTIKLHLVVWNRTENHLVRKQTLNYLAQLAK